MAATKKFKLFRTISIVVLAISGILYLLADRYLIEHVEIVQAVVPTSTVVEAAQEIQIQPTQEVTATAVSITANDWNYQSGNVSISLEEVSSGSGNDKVTYFVADIYLSDATDISSAFAKNEFGTNIIEYTSEIAEDNNAIFAVNGDYYGFRDDGIVIRNGVIYRDEPARMGLAFYRDGSLNIYDETRTTAQQLLDQGVWQTLSFGPALIENSVVDTEFGKVSVDTNVGNHTIQGNNPRTGVGIIDENHFVFVVVDGRSKGYSRGVSLAEFSQIFAGLGCTDAYNIDGGGSSTMYFNGQVANNPLGKNKERGTSDILYIADER